MDHASRRVQAEVKKCRKEAPDFTQTEKGESATKSWEVLGHAPEETDRSNALEDAGRERRTELAQLYRQ